MKLRFLHIITLNYIIITFIRKYCNIFESTKSISFEYMRRTGHFVHRIRLMPICQTFNICLSSGGVDPDSSWSSWSLEWTESNDLGATIATAASVLASCLFYIVQNVSQAPARLRRQPD